MMVAAKTITATVIDLFKNQELIVKAKVEFKNRRGLNFIYKPLLGNRPPSLNYRK